MQQWESREMWNRMHLLWNGRCGAFVFSSRSLIATAASTIKLIHTFCFQNPTRNLLLINILLHSLIVFHLPRSRSTNVVGVGVHDFVGGDGKRVVLPADPPGRSGGGWLPPTGSGGRRRGCLSDRIGVCVVYKAVSAWPGTQLRHRKGGTGPWRRGRHMKVPESSMSADYGVWINNKNNRNWKKKNSSAMDK